MKNIIALMLLISSVLSGANLSGAYVYLYDVNHPEWLSNISESTIDENGNYSFTELVNSSSNGNSYIDGDPIPEGVYTILVYKPSVFDPVTGTTSEPIVTVLSPNLNSGGYSDLETLDSLSYEIIPSDVAPNVVTMFDMNKNTDGTYTWGPASSLQNNTIQITFDMPMSRGSIQNITVTSTNDGSISGNWKLSPDWKTATFNPLVELSEGDYSLTIPSSTTNVYGNVIGYDAIGTFTIVNQPIDSISSFSIDIQQGWQLLGAIDDINTSVFDNKCIDFIWAYDSTSSTNPWKLYIANGKTYSNVSDYPPIATLQKNEGFWILGNDTCTVTVSTASIQE